MTTQNELANAETLLRQATEWIKTNNYKFSRDAWYGNSYCPIRALIKMNGKTDPLPAAAVTIAAKMLNVSDEWVRAFMYGFACNRPQLKNQDGINLARPREAYNLGWKMSLEFCGPCPYHWEDLDTGLR